MPFGISPIISSGLNSSYDPRNYNLTGWWQGKNYIAGTNEIPGTNSLGISGSHKLYDNTFSNVYPPSLDGTLLNGIPVLNCTPSIVFLETDAVASTFWTNTTAQVIMLVNVTIGFDSGTLSPIYANRMIFGERADYIGLYGVNNGGLGDVYGFVYDGADKTGVSSINYNEWTILTFSLDNGFIYTRRNRNSFDVGNATGNVFDLTNTLALSNGLGNMRGYIAEIMIANSLNHTELDNLAIYLSNKYALGF